MLESPFSDAPLRVGRKGQALLACAAMQASSGVSRSRLIALLWPDQSDEDARAALRQCLHLMRRLLGPAGDGLGSDGDHIVLRDSAFDVDVRRFEALAARGDLEAMLAAADLYRGDFVGTLDAGVEFGCWAEAERERLRNLAHGVLTRLSECADGAFACDATVQLAHRLLAGDAVHEGCYRALMRLHARAGLGAKVLQTWNDCRRVLRRELDIEPSAETAAVMEQLRGDGGRATMAAQPPTAVPGIGSAAASRVLLPGHGAEDPVVIDLLLRGWQFYTLFTAEGNSKARAAFEAAVERAPRHAEALARLGWTYWIGSISGWDADPVKSSEQAWKCASRAIACNRGHPAPHTLMGKVLLWRMEHEEALEQLRHAVEIAPSFAYAHFHLGDAAMWCGRCDEALAHESRALDLDQNDHGMFLTIRGFALWMMGQLGEAQAALDSAITRNPTYAWPHGALVAVHAERGDLDAARAAAATARRLNRRFSLSFAERVMPFAQAGQRRRMVEAWRIAGVAPFEPTAGLPVAGDPRQRDALV
ncbi:MAG TPA: BTAD domain-containing putative transcriptional regulator [Ramlibacter sp.]|nr:BTAD domain-containing putative transcriptional regulator [Ramlibacter sp.]